MQNLRKRLSIHRPSKQKLGHLSDDAFGHYLAGVLDGDGHISTQGQIVICFNEKDIADAYTLRTRIGYGHVRPMKGAAAATLIFSKKAGIIRVADLIRDKLKHPNRIKQFNTRLCQKTSENSEIN